MKKIFSFLVVLAVAVIGLQNIPVKKTEAAGSLPVLSFQMGDHYNTATALCDSVGGQRTTTDIAPNTSGPATDVGNFEPDCSRLMIVTPPPYTHDFKIGVRVGYSSNGATSACDTWGQWTYTNAATAGGGYSPWAHNPISGERHYECVQVQVQDLGPIPGGGTVKDLAVAYQPAEGDYSCMAGAPSVPGYPAVAGAAGVWSNWGSAGESPDCGRINLIKAAAPVVAAGETQFHADHITIIPNDGSTGSDAYIFLDAQLPASTSNTSQDAQCPVGPPRRIPESTDNSDNYAFTGFEVKPVGTPFNGIGIIPATSVTTDPGGDTYSLTESVVPLNGSYHWTMHYTHSTQSMTLFCDGSSKTVTTGPFPITSGDLTFVVPPPVPLPQITDVTVASVNSQIPSSSVTSSWAFPIVTDLLGNPLPDLCTPTSSCTNRSSGAYEAQPGTYTNMPLSSSAQGYALRSVEKVPIAEKREPFDALLAFGEKLIGVAHAVVDCGILNAAPTSCPPTSSGIFTLTANANDTANFLIVWDPIANLGINPTTLNFTGGTTNGTMNVVNTGAPGSILAWNGTVTSGSSWLSLSPASGIVTNGPTSGNSQPVTITANTASLANGSYDGTISFSGTSAPGTPAAPIAPQTLSVHLVVSNAATCGNGVKEPGEQCDKGAANGLCPATCSAACKTQNSCAPLPSCTFTSSPSKIVVPQTATLSWNCTHVTSCTLSGGEFDGGVPVTVDTTTNTAVGSKSAAPKKDTSYTLSCHGEDPSGTNPNYQQNVNVQVTVQTPGRIETNP